MKVLNSISEVRQACSQHRRLGFVPTMGALHEGHLALVRRAKLQCEFVAVSIFVNPIQFAAGEDFAQYPRDIEQDLELLQRNEVDLVFVPSAAEIFPDGFDTHVHVGTVTQRLEAAVRPGHFDGVATVVTKLFNIVQPYRAYFGQKDAQQCVVIQKLVRDLNLGCQIAIEPTVRESDGLAMSSRNVFLTSEQRLQALVLFKALTAAKTRFMDGERDAAALRSIVKDIVAEAPSATIDYISVADSTDLRELDDVDRAALLSLAVRIGSVRLLDNVLLE
jgi:pantoate--beta-alanine ligase